MFHDSKQLRGKQVVMLGIGFFTTAFLLCMDVHAQTQASGGTDDAKESATSIKRDPFWPVGYVPEHVEKQEVKTPVAKEPRSSGNNWSAATKKIVVNGVSSRANNEFYAVINGTVKSVGDTISINHEGTTYTWAVDRIEPPSSVKLRRVSTR